MGLGTTYTILGEAPGLSSKIWDRAGGNHRTFIETSSGRETVPSPVRPAPAPGPGQRVRAMTAAEGIRIVAAGPADAMRLARLNRTVQALHAAERPAIFRAEASLAEIADEFARGLDDPARFALIAVVPGADAGYAYCELLETGGDAFTHPRRRGVLHHIGVEPAYRRRGVAMRLIAASVARFRDRGATEWAATYWSFNTASAALMAKAGLTVSLIRAEAPL